MALVRSGAMMRGESPAIAHPAGVATMFVRSLVMLAVLVVGLAIPGRAAARPAAELEPLALTVEDAGQGFGITEQHADVLEPDAFVRVLQRSVLSFSSVTIVLLGRSTLTPRAAMEQTVRGVLQNRVAADLTPVPRPALPDEGDSAASFALAGIVEGQPFRVLVSAWRAGDVLAVVMANSAVAPPETEAEVTVRLTHYVQQQRDKLTAHGLPPTAPAVIPTTPAP